MPDDVRGRIRDFLAPHLGGRPLADHDDYFTLGYVNSLFAMQLLVFVENEFDVKIAPEHMVFENFRTVNGLLRLLDLAKSRRYPAT
ncbi:acyl carrier protein [Nocardia sp. NPDC051911]|uniref:acyl carrier protein n=1 Tax=Nocardia sp. NPDC051911 TaxID=3154648 RepID=UPI003428FE19